MKAKIDLEMQALRESISESLQDIKRCESILEVLERINEDSSPAQRLTTSVKITRRKKTLQDRLVEFFERKTVGVHVTSSEVYKAFKNVNRNSLTGAISHLKNKKILGGDGRGSYWLLPPEE